MSTITRRDAPFVPGRTALLLVDMQKIWLEPAMREGSNDYFGQELAQRVIPNQQLVLAAAREAGIEVIHTIIRSLTKDGRDRSLDHRLTPIHVAPDDPLALPVDALAPADDEILLPKTSSGVFNSTNLEYLLRNLDIAQLIVMGIMTDQCIDMAVRDGADRGFAVTCIGDACGAKSASRHDNALQAFGGYCWVTDTDTVVSRLAAMERAA